MQQYHESTALFVSLIPTYNFNLHFDHHHQQGNEESEMLSQFWDLPSIKKRFKSVFLSYHLNNNSTTDMVFTQQRDISVPSYFKAIYPKNTPCYDMLDTIEKLIVRHGESFRILSVALSRCSPQPHYPDRSSYQLSVAQLRLGRQPSYSDPSHQQEDQIITDNLLTSIFGRCKNLKSLGLKYLEINKIYDAPLRIEFSLNSLYLADHEWRKKRNIFYSIQCNSIKQITIQEPQSNSVTAFNTERKFK